MNDMSQPSPAAPVTPAQKPASRRTLYLVLAGICVFLCACLCLAACVAGVYEISRLQNGNAFGGSLNSRRASNAAWQVEVTGVQSSTAEITDSTGGSASPKAGYVFIVVTATVKNISGESQNFFLSAASSDATLADKNGNSLDLAAVSKGGSVTINFANQVQMMFIYSDEATWEFYFVAADDDRGPFTFTFKDLSPLGPLSLP